MAFSPEERIQEIEEYLGRARRGLMEAARQIPENRWKQTPRPGAWSGAEVIAHLITVERRTVDGLGKITNEALREPPFWKGWRLPLGFAKWRGVKIKSPIPLDAEMLREREAMLVELERGRARTIEWMEANRRRDLSMFWMRHPFFGPLDPYDWLEVTAHHENRHKQQIVEIAAELPR